MLNKKNYIIMKAIILCCDKYQICAYHTIKTYELLLKGANFNYFLPYNQKVEEYIKKLRKDIDKRIELIVTQNKSFLATMSKLLNYVDDEEYVFW